MVLSLLWLLCIFLKSSRGLKCINLQVFLLAEFVSLSREHNVRKLIITLSIVLSACAKSSNPVIPNTPPVVPQDCISLQTDLIASGQAYDYVHNVSIAPLITEINAQGSSITTTVNSNVPAGNIAIADFTLADNGNEHVSSADGIAIVVETTGTTCTQLMVEETITDWSVSPVVSYHVTQLYIAKILEIDMEDKHEEKAD